MAKIIIGVLFIVGGLSGKLALIGTNSPRALAVVGGVLVAWGVFNIVRGRASGAPGPGGSGPPGSA